MYATTGEVISSEERVPGYVVRRFVWTSSTSGSVRVNGLMLKGYAYELRTKPDAGAAPSLNYDVIIYNQLGADVLLGNGVDRSNVDAERAFIYETDPAVIEPTSGQHVLAIDNAGSQKSGVIELWMRDA